MPALPGWLFRLATLSSLLHRSIARDLHFVASAGPSCLICPCLPPPPLQPPSCSVTPSPPPCPRSPITSNHHRRALSASLQGTHGGTAAPAHGVRPIMAPRDVNMTGKGWVAAGSCNQQHHGQCIKELQALPVHGGTAHTQGGQNQQLLKGKRSDVLTEGCLHMCRRCKATKNKGTAGGNHSWKKRRNCQCMNWLDVLPLVSTASIVRSAAATLNQRLEECTGSTTRLAWPDGHASGSRLGSTYPTYDAAVPKRPACHSHRMVFRRCSAVMGNRGCCAQQHSSIRWHLPSHADVPELRKTCAATVQVH